MTGVTTHKDQNGHWFATITASGEQLGPFKLQRLAKQAAYWHLRNEHSTYARMLTVSEKPTRGAPGRRDGTKP